MNGKVAKRLRREAAEGKDFKTEKEKAAEGETPHIVGYKNMLVTHKVKVQMDEEGKIFEEMEIDNIEPMPIIKYYIDPPNTNAFMNKYRKIKKNYIGKEKI